MSNDAHTLRAKSVDVRIGHRDVLHDFNIEVCSGKIIALLGANGAGKSTAFAVLSGLRKPSCGQVLMDNQDLSKNSFSDRAAQGIIYLPQENSLFRELTAADNIMAVLELRSQLSSQQRTDKTGELLQRFGLLSLHGQMADSLSGGERRRLEIARAMAMQPKFLLLDEPFAAMDPISIHQLQVILVELKSAGPGILVTDHNLREVLKLSDYSYVMHCGETIAQGSAEAVLASEKVKKLYTGRSIGI